jgi:hypothetical protein
MLEMPSSHQNCPLDPLRFTSTEGAITIFSLVEAIIFAILIFICMYFESYKCY